MQERKEKMKKRYRLNIAKFTNFMLAVAMLIVFFCLCVDIYRNPAHYLTTY